jgi:hypothetical protein
LLDVYVVGIERKQPIDDELSLGRAQDTDLLEMEQIPARWRVEAFLLATIVDANSGRLRRIAGEAIAWVETVEPLQRSIYLAIPKSGTHELLTKLVAIGLRLTITIDEGFE